MAANRELLTAVFYDERAANAALRGVRYLEDSGSPGVLDAAMVKKDEQGKYHVRFASDLTGSLSARRGALFDTMLGSMIAEMSSATGSKLGPSAERLAEAAKEYRIDFNFPSQFVDNIGEALGAGSTAIFALVEYRLGDRAERELLAQDGRVARAALRDGVESEFIVLQGRLRNRQ